METDPLKRVKVSSQTFVDRAHDFTYPNDGDSYSILWDQRAAFPVDTSDWPVNIAGRRQFFIDDFLIAERENLKVTVHQARKHAANPIIVPDQPWEGQRGVIVQHVMRDPENGHLRMWYLTRRGEFTTQEGAATNSALLHATSSDGISWSKPSLNQHPWRGSTANNIIEPNLGLSAFLQEPEGSISQRCYKSVCAIRGGGLDRYKGTFQLATSPDGFKWTVHPQPIAPMYKRAQPGYRGRQLGLGDTNSVIYDHRLGCYVWHTKVFVGGKRARAMMESEDLIHWTPPRVILCADDQDPPDTQLYDSYPIPYESIWLAPLRVYHWKNFKRVDVQLAHSRDGRHYMRTAGRQVFLPNGPTDGWDPDYIILTPAVYVDMGDELWIYYTGSRNPARGHDEWQHRIGLATMKRDRFVSIDGPENEGYLTTRPLDHDGRTLHLNADASRGHIRVGVLDEQGEPLGGMDTADCIPCTVDSLDHIIEWKGCQTFDPKKHQRIRLRITLHEASLFSFWIA